MNMCCVGLGSVCVHLSLSTILHILLRRLVSTYCSHNAHRCNITLHAQRTQGVIFCKHVPKHDDYIIIKYTIWTRASCANNGAKCLLWCVCVCVCVWQWHKWHKSITRRTVENSEQQQAIAVSHSDNVRQNGGNTFKMKNDANGSRCHSCWLANSILFLVASSSRLV